MRPQLITAFRFASSSSFQRRAPPPNKIDPSTFVAPPACNNDNSNNENSSNSHHNNSNSIAPAVITLLASIPRDGVLAHKAAINSGLPLHRFAAALDWLRAHNSHVGLLHFVRSSQNGNERLIWRETAMCDDKRLSLDAVRGMFAELASESVRKPDAKVSSPSSSSSTTATAEDKEEEKDGADNDNDNDAQPDFVQGLVDSLRREVAQERAARLAEEKRADKDRNRLLSLLRFIALRKGLRPRRKSKKKKQSGVSEKPTA